MALRALAVGAHPDDVEFMMAGTLLRLREAGYELHLVHLADGSCGSIEHDAATTAAIRRAEALSAARLIGAVYHASLVADLEILYELPLLRRLAALVREVSPDVILTHGPAEYMEDHTNTCRLTVTAAFARGMPNFTVEPARPAVNRPVTLYHALPYGLHDPLGRPVRPGIYVDITPVLATKRAMLAAHRSQKEWLDVSQGIDAYLATMEGMSRQVGAMSGRYSYAEGWTRHLPLGFCADDANPLLEALGEAAFAVASPAN